MAYSRMKSWPLFWPKHAVCAFSQDKNAFLLTIYLFLDMKRIF